MTSIIISTFNGKEFLTNCIHSIKLYTKTPYEIIVVDNGSRDDTLDFCRQQKITCISLSENKGFPAACNLGLNVASGDALLLLNNDVIVSHHWLSNMLNCLYSRDNIGIVGPTSNYVSGKQYVDIAYSDLEQLHRMTEKLNLADKSKWIKVKRLVGFCFLFKRELLERVGLLDERFSPGYYEDDDYCYRARREGYRLMIAGDVFVHHYGSASFSRKNQDDLLKIVSENYRTGQVRRL